MRPFPVQYKTFCFGERQLQLQVPDTAVLRTQLANEAQAVPYWAKLWPAAMALSGFIADNALLLSGKRVLELAAGLGLPGMVAAKYANAVTISDYAGEAVALMQQAVVLNGLHNVDCRLLDWGALPDGVFGAEVLLLSDVNYAPADFEVLYEVLRRFLRGGTTIILATPQRLLAKPFISRLMEWCCGQDERFVEGVWVSLYVLREK